jgi:quinol-cytochrome oxidoreductase complex cytochrome b subunit
MPGHQYEIDAMKDKEKPLHPLWTGVGCILMVALVALGYLAADLVIRADMDANWFPLPVQLAFPAQYPYMPIKIMAAVLVLLLGSALISLIYSVIFPRKPGRFEVTDPSIFPPPPRTRRH